MKNKEMLDKIAKGVHFRTITDAGESQGESVGYDSFAHFLDQLDTNAKGGLSIGGKLETFCQLAIDEVETMDGLLCKNYKMQIDNHKQIVLNRIAWLVDQPEFDKETFKKQLADMREKTTFKPNEKTEKSAEDLLFFNIMSGETKTVSFLGKSNEELQLATFDFDEKQIIVSVYEEQAYNEGKEVKVFRGFIDRKDILHLPDIEQVIQHLVFSKKHLFFGKDLVIESSQPSLITKKLLV